MIIFRRCRLCCVPGVLFVCLVVAAGFTTPVASAAAQYNLTGTWDTYATGGGYTGEFVISAMNMSTGAFSGIGDGSLDLEGTESGGSVTFTQSTGGYVADDSATLEVSNGALQMVNGTWSDGSSSGTFSATDQTVLRSDTTTIGCLLPDGSSPLLSCTTTVSDTSAASPAQTPTGTVSLSSNNGTLSATSCTLAPVPSSTTDASCAFNFTPPPDVANGDSAPQLTGQYPGDSNFEASNGTQTLSCNSGLIYQVSGATDSAPTTNGYRTGSTMTLSGCGLTTTTLARFGSKNATAKPTSVSADGTSAVFTVPDTAITGQLTVSDPSYVSVHRASLAKPDPLEIDSWRNTDGFSFVNNFVETATPQELIDVYGKSVLVPGSSTELLPWVDAWLGSHAVNNGLCFGMSLTAAEFAMGLLQPSQLDPGAKVATDIKATPEVVKFLTEQQMRQWSDQGLPFFVRTKTFDSELDVLSRYDGYADADAFTNPVIFGIWDGTGGHAEAAYGETATSLDDFFPLNGAIAFETYDPNLPFSPAEDGDTMGGTHDYALWKSWLQMTPDGGWKSLENSMSSTSNNIRPMPAGAFTGQLTLTRAKWFTRKSLGMVVPENSLLHSLTDASGKAVDLTGDSPELTVEPDLNGTPTAAGATKPSGGAGGIGQLILQSPSATAVLSASTGSLGAFWQGHSGDAELSAGKGRLLTSFNSRTNTVSVSPSTGEAAPRSSTLTVIDSVDAGAVERVLTVSGPPHLSAELGSRAEITASGSGQYVVTLSTVGKGVSGQSVPLGTLALRAGQTLLIQPHNWDRLAVTKLSAMRRSKRGSAVAVRLHRGAMPTAVISKLSHRNALLHLTVRVPALTADQGTITVSAVLRTGRKVIATGKTSVAAGGRARTLHMRIKLNHVPHKGERLTLQTVTDNGGTTPSETVSVRRTTKL
jgi:hypothetical protein